jgi:hypothetical protein
MTKRGKYNLFPLASTPGYSRYPILEYVEELQEGMIITISLDGDREHTEDGSPIGFPSGRTEKVRVHLQQPDGSKPNHPGSCVCESCHPWWVAYPTDDPGIINTTPHPITFQSSKPEALHFFDFKDGYNGAERCAICGAWADEADSVECKPDTYILPTYRSDAIINATVIEEFVRNCPGGAELVFTRFEASAHEERKLTRIEKQNPGAIIVGSIIAAQAFPGRVYATIPAPGFERVPPAEKRMRDDKFLVF